MTTARFCVRFFGTDYIQEAVSSSVVVCADADADTDADTMHSDAGQLSESNLIQVISTRFLQDLALYWRQAFETSAKSFLNLESRFSFPLLTQAEQGHSSHRAQSLYKSVHQ